MKVIIGAGLSGLICGALNAQARIHERNDASFVGHRALLRFRDDKIARALGLTFRKVTVRKGIWADEGFWQPSPRLANWYSQKVRGVIAENSIWNLAPSERFIAPDDLHSILADICGSRVHWGVTITSHDYAEWWAQRIRVISTIPLPVLLSTLDIPNPLAFNHSPISVYRYRIPDCDVFQTIYFPSPNTSLYRATLTGELLTLESIMPRRPDDEALLYEMARVAFGLWDHGTQISGEHRQPYGKIVPVDEVVRKAFLHKLTTEWGIYSLGRFATWRNILLDDVFDDIAVIRRMMNLNQYDVSVERTKS